MAGTALPPIQPAQNFAAAQKESVKLFIEHNWDKDARRRAVAARELIDLQGRSRPQWRELGTTVINDLAKLRDLLITASLA